MTGPYFSAALSMRGRRAVIFGGGKVGAQKCARLLRAGARVSLFAASPDESYLPWIESGAIEWQPRSPDEDDVRDASLVFLVETNTADASRFHAWAKQHRFLLWAMDYPDFCDVVLNSVLQSGPVEISVSTGGTAPMLARRIREELERIFDDRFGKFAERVAAVRHAHRHRPLPERFRLLEEALRGFALHGAVSYPDWEKTDPTAPPE